MINAIIIFFKNLFKKNKPNEVNEEIEEIEDVKLSCGGKNFISTPPSPSISIQSSQPHPRPVLRREIPQPQRSTFRYGGYRPTRGVQASQNNDLDTVIDDLADVASTIAINELFTSSSNNISDTDDSYKSFDTDSASSSSDFSSSGDD